MINKNESFELTFDLKSKIDKVLEEHNYDYTQIVGILVHVQDLIKGNYIPKIVAYYISERVPDAKISTIYDCITFYDALSDKMRGHFTIEICDNIVCKVNNNQFLINTLKKLLNIDFGTVTYDGKFYLQKVACFGACDIAPAIRINGEIFGNLDSEEKIREVLSKFV